VSRFVDELIDRPEKVVDHVIHVERLPLSGHFW
jgi:hypothetical protein